MIESAEGNHRLIIPGELASLVRLVIVGQVVLRRHYAGREREPQFRIVARQASWIQPAAGSEQLARPAALLDRSANAIAGSAQVALGPGPVLKLAENGL